MQWLLRKKKRREGAFQSYGNLRISTRDLESVEGSRAVPAEFPTEGRKEKTKVECDFISIFFYAFPYRERVKLRPRRLLKPDPKPLHNKSMKSASNSF
ncbi:hypothetical protein V6N13_064497 [Hibiscus sabdariffa]